jgi:hypothetical protein
MKIFIKKMFFYFNFRNFTWFESSGLHLLIIFAQASEQVHQAKAHPKTYLPLISKATNTHHHSNFMTQK